MLRVGILGPGGIAARHAQAALALPATMSLVAVCGRDAMKTQTFASRYGAKPYADLDRMLGEARLDLLIVALPPFAHAGQVETAAAAGVNLLVEKPIALSLERAASMVEASVKQWDVSDHGPTYHVSASFHSNALHADWWRTRAKSGGQMVEQLIHLVDLARHWLGMPQSVYARASNLTHRDTPGYDSEDVSAVVLGYDDGRIGVLHASNAAIPGRWMKQWQIVAARMTGIFVDMNSAEFVRTHSEVSSETVASTRDVFISQLEDVASAITDRRPPSVPLSDGADALRIVLAARQSADERREVLL
jgi:predicted dehydrogenase